MGISTALAARMMTDAGMGENAIIAAFSDLRPIATFDGAKYWNPSQVSRAIKRYMTEA